MEQTMRAYTSNLIVNLYRLHDYELTKEKLDAIISCLDETLVVDNLSKQMADDFFKRVRGGFYGVLYSQPTCLSSMYNKHFGRDYMPNGKRRTIC